MTPTAIAIPTAELHQSTTGTDENSTSQLVVDTPRGDSCLVVGGTEQKFGADIAIGVEKVDAGTAWLHFVRSCAVLVAVIALGLLIARHYVIDPQSASFGSNGTPSAQSQGSHSSGTTVPVRASVTASGE